MVAGAESMELSRDSVLGWLSVEPLAAVGSLTQSLHNCVELLFPLPQVPRCISIGIHISLVYQAHAVEAGQ